MFKLPKKVRAAPRLTSQEMADRMKQVADLREAGKIPDLTEEQQESYRAFVHLVMGSILAAEKGEPHPVQGMGLTLALNVKTGQFAPCISLVTRHETKQEGEHTVEETSEAIMGVFLPPSAAADYIPVNAVSGEYALGVDDKGNAFDLSQGDGTIH